MRRALSILFTFTRKSGGYEHPYLNGTKANYIVILKKLGRNDEDVEKEIQKLLAEP